MGKQGKVSGQVSASEYKDVEANHDQHHHEGGQADPNAACSLIVWGDRGRHQPRTHTCRRTVRSDHMSNIEKVQAAIKLINGRYTHREQPGFWTR